MNVKSFAKGLLVSAALVAAGAASATSYSYDLGSISTTSITWLTSSGGSSSATLLPDGDYTVSFTLSGGEGDLSLSSSFSTFVLDAVTLTGSGGAITADLGSGSSTNSSSYSFSGLTSGSYSLTFSVASGAAATGSLSFTYTGGDNGVVPEPGSIALTLAGLSVVGLVARRRKSS